MQKTSNDAIIRSTAANHGAECPKTPTGYALSNPKSDLNPPAALPTLRIQHTVLLVHTEYDPADRRTNSQTKPSPDTVPRTMEHDVEQKRVSERLGHSYELHLNRPPLLLQNPSPVANRLQITPSNYKYEGWAAVDRPEGLPSVVYSISRPRSGKRFSWIIIMAGRAVLLAATLLALYVCLPSVVSSPVGDDARTSSTARAPTHGAVASESRFCSGYGGDMLEKGGNAADAVS
jgi:hypothetical protein